MEWVDISKEIKSGRWFSLEDYPNEVWKNVSGYEGLYVVSNYGRVKRLPVYVNIRYGRRLCKSCIKSMHLQNTGYYMLDLYKNNKRKNLLLHRVMANVFIPNPLNLPMINHKDGNRTNNVIFINNDGTVNFEKSNLEWCTQKENVNHAYHVLGREGNRKGCYGKLCYNAIPICAMDKNNKIVMTFDCIMEAQRRTGIKQSQISCCLSGRAKTAGGFVWKKI